MDMKCEQPASGARPLRRYALDEPGDDVVSDAVAMWAERVPRRMSEDCSVRTRSCRKRTIDRKNLASDGHSHVVPPYDEQPLH